MKKILYSVLAVAVVLFTASCDESRLEIPQKGVTTYETFYQTDEDALSALTAAYARYACYVPGRGKASIYVPIRAALNMCADDAYAAGSNFGDNDFMGSLNEFRYDSGNEVLENLYQGLFLANYACNLVIDHFKDGLPNGGPTETTKRAVAEARVLRAHIYFILTALWNTPPMIDHVISDGLPYNSDKDPENPMSHEDLFKWVAKECEDAVPFLDERKSTTDKNGAVKVTKGFAWALEGKALLFAKDYAGAKTALKKVIDSGKYALVPGNKYWQNFHIEGDCNEEKIFESNIEKDATMTSGGQLGSRMTWMEAQIWNWRSDHCMLPPQAVYDGGVDGWGGLGVPLWFGDEFFANDGHSYRFDATLKHVDDAFYGMEYNTKEINEMSLEKKKASKEIGILDVKDGLYGQSFWLPFKQIMRVTDAWSKGKNYRVNNNIVMRYAEVLLLYAEACLQTGDNAQATWAVNQIQQRAGSKTISANVDMETLKKEKSYELWNEGCRWLDLVRWGDTAKVKQAGQAVPKLFDKLFREPKAGEQVIWENGSEANSRFYMVYTHEAIDANWKVGFKEGRHEFFPFPTSVMDKNPNLVQNPGWTGTE